MKLFPAGLLVLTLAGAGRAQTSGSCAAPFQAVLKPGVLLSIRSRSASIQIVGTDQRLLKVSCVLDHTESAKDVLLHVSGDESAASLRVSGGPTNNVQIRIEVPGKANLRIHVPAGEIKISQVTGDKVVDLHAGEVSLTGLVASEYRSASGSVSIGELHASAFKVVKDGFFRSFSTENPAGQYRLRVHVDTGTVSLE